MVHSTIIRGGAGGEGAIGAGGEGEGGMTSENEMKARFVISGQNYLLGPLFSPQKAIKCLKTELVMSSLFTMVWC